jgi:hypothetical protein
MRSPQCGQGSMNFSWVPFKNSCHEQEPGGAAGEVRGGVRPDEDEGASGKMLFEVFEFVAVRGDLLAERGAVFEERKPPSFGKGSGEAFGGHDPHDGLGFVDDPPGGACLNHRCLAGLGSKDEHEVGNIDIAETLERLAEVGGEVGAKMPRGLSLPLR